MLSRYVKYLVLKSLLLSFCFLLAACGGEDLDAYKEKALGYVAADLNTTKELLVKDYDVILDSMSVIPITVSDSIAIIESLELYKIEREKKLKDCESFRGTFLFSDKIEKNIEELKKEISEIDKSLSSLPQYKEKNCDKVLAKVFRVRMAIKFPILGRKMDFEYFLFDPDGGICHGTCPYPMKYYIKTNKQ